MADLEVCGFDLSSLLHSHQEASANGNGVLCYSASVPLLKGLGGYMETRSGCSSRAVRERKFWREKLLSYVRFHISRTRDGGSCASDFLREYSREKDREGIGTE